MHSKTEGDELDLHQQFADVDPKETRKERTQTPKSTIPGKLAENRAGQ